MTKLTSVLTLEVASMAHGNDGRLYTDPSKVPLNDVVPDQFLFTDQTGVAQSSTRTSAPVIIAGLGDESAITFTAGNGTIDVNGDADFQVSRDDVVNGDTIRARHTSSSSLSTAVSTIVTGGGVTDTFTSTTLAEVGAAAVVPAVYPLELVMPRAAGTRPSTDAPQGTATPNISSNHPIFRAYPGIEYNRPAMSFGGSLPHEYWVTDGPTGLTCDAVTGEISFANPTTNFSYTMHVRDAENVEIESPVSVTVTTTGFTFVDSANAAGGRNGTFANPWNSVTELLADSTAGDIVYWKNGTYSTNITPHNTGGSTGEFTPPGNWRRLDVNAGGGGPRAVAWVAYPGHAPVFDGGYVINVSQGNLLRITGSATNPVYIDGLKFQNYYHIGLQIAVGGNYDVFRRSEWDHIANSINSANSSCIDSLSSSGNAPRFYVLYQDCYMHDSAPGPIKVYWQYKSLMERCRFINLGGAPEMHVTSQNTFAGGPDHKAVCGRFEVRYCEFNNQPPIGELADGNGANHDAGFGGNMNDGDFVADNITASGEFRYNKVGGFDRPGLRVVNMNNFNNAGRIDVYCNTGVGRWNVENSDGGNGGDFRFYRNLIVNDTGSAATAFDRITFSGGTPGTGTHVTLGTGESANLALSIAAADDIVIDDVTLQLIGASRTAYLGQIGHELPGVFE
jgi:hypothetical protein